MYIKSISEQLLEFRAINNLTQERLAKMMEGKCSKANISNWELGNFEPNGRYMYRLAQVARKFDYKFNLEKY